jgi:aryl-alcohol dehydrogenase-like predicted oxidoreductase
MEKRTLGSTGERLSIVGFGGIVVKDVEPSFAAEVVARAFEERGINYFDVAPNYGNAQERLGPALAPYRDRCFLACKTTMRTAGEAERQLAESLRLLRTDHVDLYQFHSVKTEDDVQQILGPGGALEAFVRAREQGKVRFIGFSAHTEYAAHALMGAFAFDTILFPINWVAWNEGGFGPTVVEKAKSEGLGILALKALAKRNWHEGERSESAKTWYRPVETFEEAELGLRFTLSRPVTAAVSPGEADLLWWACDAADSFSPLSSEEEKSVRERARGVDPIFPNTR